MKVNVTSSKGLESNLTVVVTKKEIQDKIDLRLDEVKGTVNLKGFRPGKAPKELLKKQFGKALYGEVIEKTLNDSTFKALKDNNIKPAGQPKIDIKSSGEDKDLEFTIQVEKIPEIKSVKLDKIEIQKYEVKADKKDLENRLNQLAESSKKYNDKEQGKTAEKNDLVELLCLPPFLTPNKAIRNLATHLPTASHHAVARHYSSFLADNGDAVIVDELAGRLRSLLVAGTLQIAVPRSFFCRAMARNQSLSRSLVGHCLPALPQRIFEFEYLDVFYGSFLDEVQAI